MIKIIEVKTKRQLGEFVRFPFKLYSGSKFWVPPLLFDETDTLDKNKNPAFEYCEAAYWLAFKDGKAAGRIAGIINHEYIRKWGKKLARFGWIDFIDDTEVSAALLNTVEAWAEEKGMDGLHGPLGFCDLDREGMLVEGFEEQGMLITIYNHPYYMKHLDALGYSKDTDWVEYRIKVPEAIPDRLSRLNAAVMNRQELTVLKFKKAGMLLPYADGVFKLLNEAYRELYGVVPLTPKQIAAYTKQYFGFINPEYVRVITDRQGEVVAFGIAVPSLAEALQKARGRLLPFGFLYILKALRKCEVLDLYLIAVKPQLQGKGLNALLMEEVTRSSIRNGVKFAETGPELETNHKIQALWKNYDSRQHKRRRCYIRMFQNGILPQ